MAQEKIACTSCGGMGIIGSVCEYCGSIVQPSIPIVEKELPTAGKKNVSSEQYAEKISKYQTVSEYYGDLAVVSIGKLLGCINRKGDLVINLTNDDIIPCPLLNVFFLVANNKISVIDINGKYLWGPKDNIIPFGVDSFAVQENNLWGVLNREGKAIIPIEYSWIYRAYTGTNCLDKSKKKSNLTHQINIVPSASLRDILENASGKLQAIKIVKENYGLSLQEALSIVELGIDCSSMKSEEVSNCNSFVGKRNGKFGIIKTDGAEILSFVYQNIIVYDGWYAVQSDEMKWGVVKDDATIIIPCNYDSLIFNGNFVRVVMNGDSGHSSNATQGIYRFKDYEALEVLPCIYDRISIEEHWFEVWKEKRCGLFTFAGNEIIPCRYHEIKKDGSNKLKIYYNPFYMKGSYPLVIQMEGDKVIKGDSPKGLESYAFGAMLCIGLSIVLFFLLIYSFNLLNFGLSLLLFLFLFFSLWGGGTLLLRYNNLKKYKIL